MVCGARQRSRPFNYVTLHECTYVHYDLITARPSIEYCTCTGRYSTLACALAACCCSFDFSINCLLPSRVLLAYQKDTINPLTLAIVSLAM